MKLRLPAFTSLLVLLLGCMLAEAGCSRAPSRPATVPVRGRITYRGEPIRHATVTFLAPGAPRLAVGTTDEQGRFRLTTYVPDDGAVPGSHVVTVKSNAVVPSSQSQSGPAAVASPEAIEQAMQQAAIAVSKPAGKNARLPPKYGDRKTSDLRVDVADGENSLEIELSD